MLTQLVRPSAVGIYAAALRAGQLKMLFLTSVNMMSRSLRRDLHDRGERMYLDAPYKTLTRWIVVGTLPIFLLVTVVPGEVMSIFGSESSEGEGALLILLAGQLVNIATGTAGFIPVMVGGRDGTSPSTPAPLRSMSGLPYGSAPATGSLARPSPTR